VKKRSSWPEGRSLLLLVTKEGEPCRDNPQKPPKEGQPKDPNSITVEKMHHEHGSVLKSLIEGGDWTEMSNFLKKKELRKETNRKGADNRERHEGGD